MSHFLYIQSFFLNLLLPAHIAFQTQFNDYSTCLLWNYEEMMDVIHNFNCVIAVVAGHDHDGCYGVDSQGVQHITFPAIVETHPEDNAYATAKLWKNRLTISGVGRVSNCDIALRFAI